MKNLAPKRVKLSNPCYIRFSNKLVEYIVADHSDIFIVDLDKNYGIVGIEILEDCVIETFVQNKF